MYGVDAEKLREYCQIDAEQAERFVKEYRCAFPRLVEFQEREKQRSIWIRELKANNRRNKRMRRHSK